jgi:hypothetical protein
MWYTRLFHSASSSLAQTLHFQSGQAHDAARTDYIVSASVALGTTNKVATKEVVREPEIHDSWENTLSSPLSTEPLTSSGALRSGPLPPLLPRLRTSSRSSFNCSSFFLKSSSSRQPSRCQVPWLNAKPSSPSKSSASPQQIKTAAATKPSSRH